MKSIKKLVESTLVINKSEFINFLYPVSSVDDANKYLEEIKNLHPNANHHCFAYVIGHNQEFQKFSDDGEPSRTAGMPMLEVLKKNDLTNVLNISVRYFGGIKLGAGGLVRAYTKSCSEGIKLSNFSYLTTFNKVSVTIPFDEIGHVEKYIRENTTLLDTSYDQSVHYKIEILESDLQMITTKLNESTKGKALINVLEVQTLFN